MLVLGSRGHDYQDIYQQTDRQATVARLKILEGFDRPLQAGHRTEELAAIASLTRRIWHKLEDLAGDVSQVRAQLRRYGAHDIFEESAPFALPPFQVRAYRRGA